MRLAVLFSGGASTACAVQNAIKRGDLPGVEIVSAITDNPKAAGIQKLRDAGVSSIEVVNKKDFPNGSFGTSLNRLLEARRVDTVAQLGWLAKTPIEVINKFTGRILNQHPGPLDPENPGKDFGGKGMYGARVHAARLHFAQNTGKHNAWTEATIHHVTEKFDEGQVVGRVRIEIPADLFNQDLNSAESLRTGAENLQKIVLPKEHQLVIETLAQLSNGKLDILNRGKPLISDDELRQLEHSKQIAVEAYQQTHY